MQHCSFREKHRNIPLKKIGQKIMSFVFIAGIALLFGLPTTVKAAESASFVMIHFEAGYKGRLGDDLPIDIPAEYLTMDFGWQEYLFETAERLVQKADDYGFHLTLAFNPQWAEYILLDSARTDTVRQWQERGHEIAFHHHSLSHPDWNGYSNDPSATNNPIPFLGNVDAGLDFIKTLAEPTHVTTAMIGGLPIDMPQSYEDTTEDLIFAGGNQYDSFELYGELRSLKPTEITKVNGAKVMLVTHRQLTTILSDFTIEEALEIFKAEYSGMQPDEVYGIIFHCYDYHEAEETYNDWFEFINNRGDSIKTIDEVIADYANATADSYWPDADADWEKITAKEAGADTNDLQAAIEYGVENTTHAIVVLWKGKILKEVYAPSSGRETTAPIYSATKSIVGSMVGMIIEDGGITGVTQKTVDFLPEWVGDTTKEDITIEHHLMMTTGIEGGKENFLESLFLADDQRAFDAGIPVVHTPCTFWDYNEPAYHLLFWIIEEASELSLPEFTQSRILDPLGMTHTTWATKNRNYRWFESTALDAARFGLLALRNGEWNGTQLVSTNWIETSTAPSQALNPSYGYLWWLNEVDSHLVPFDDTPRNGSLFPDCPPDTFAALGARDNNIYVIPSLDLVVVRIGEDANGEGSVAVSEFDNRFLANFCKAFGYVAPEQTFSAGLSFPDSTEVEISIPTWNSRLYSLEKRSSLTTGKWSIVTGWNRMEGTGLPLICTNTQPKDQEFFRILTWSAMNE